MSQIQSDAKNGISVNSAVIFEQGQRRCGPPENWSGTPPGKGCEVFVAKIPKDCFETELIPIFQEIGSIYSFRLMMENELSHRGFGFCLYMTKEDAKEAVTRLNNYQIKKNWHLGVCFSVDNCRLFVGGIPKNKTKLEIFEEISSVTEDVVDIIVYPSAADKTKNRGFAFVEYSSHKTAAIARKKMITNSIQLWGQNVAVDWSEPERKVEEDIMMKVKILYVRNLMLTTSESAIYNAFSRFISQSDDIVKVKKIGDFAFVHFKSREQAEIVKNNTNGMNLEGSIVEVQFAKPVNKLEQQQKLIKKSSSTLNQALPLVLGNDFSHLSIRPNGNILPISDNSDKNGMTPSRSYRNAAGRCSLKSKKSVYSFEKNENCFFKNANVLAEICYREDWGTPVYAVQMLPIMLPNNETNGHWFLAQVYVPGINCHFPSKSPAFTQDEAISNASETALLWLFYNGLQISSNLGKRANTKEEKLLNNSFGNGSLESGNSSYSTKNNYTSQPNSSPLYIPRLYQYNPMGYFGNNYCASGIYVPMDKGQLEKDHQDQSGFSFQINTDGQQI